MFGLQIIFIMKNGEISFWLSILITFVHLYEFKISSNLNYLNILSYDIQEGELLVHHF